MTTMICIFLSLHMSNALNHPPWVVAQTAMNPTNFLPVNISNVDMPSAVLQRYSGAKDDEHLYAIKHFFDNSFNGISLEIGAVDGKTHSATSIFSEYFGWKRILVEGSPIYREKLKAVENAFAVNAVICDVPRKVHFISKIKFVSGILGANNLVQN